MLNKSIISLFFLLISYTVLSQNSFTSLTINSDLRKNSNAVIRNNEVVVEIQSIDKVVVKQHRIVTVFNESGNSKVNAEIYYDNSIAVKTLEAKIYNYLGEEIKKIKKKDFKDVSVADGFSIFNDNRAKYIEYTPTNYPYTVEFTVETIRSNTAFLPRWMPIEGYYVSTEFSSINVINNSGIELTMKTFNIEDYSSIEKISEFNYNANNLPALVAQAYSPSFTTFAPSLKFVLKSFSMEGVKGTNVSWQDFGVWMNDKLIKGTDVLPEHVIEEIKSLTKNETSNISKAKIVYDYVQKRSRYVSIQVGIGGWKPMQASDVHRLGYGDCKGLTNYTKSLLKAVGVESYYAIVYGDRDIRDLDKDFSSLEGNHAILSIPHEEDYVWLECTSQDAPFGYNANFTDDRDVLVITPNGGEIIHTKVYETARNTQVTKADISIDSDGNMQANVNVIYKGSQYNNHTNIEFQDLKEQKLFYKNHYDNINDLTINSLKLFNDKDAIMFTEDLELEARKYASKIGNRLLLAPNLFNKRTYMPPRYKERKLPFKIDRGYFDSDFYTITIPEGYDVESLIAPVDIANKFGNYKVTIERKENNKLFYTRSLTVNKGEYLKEDYVGFRDFCISIVKHDKSRIAILSNDGR